MSNPSNRTVSGQTAWVESEIQHPVLDFARQELLQFAGGEGGLRFLSAGDDPAAKAADWRFRFQVDAALPDFAFGYTVRGQENARVVTLRGNTPTCVLHALYTLLEDAGYLFEICGPVAPDRLELEGLVGKDVLVQPCVQRRGIRQHMNFPMDLSSYPLDEACQYIRNLARLRFNHIVFHSYPNQWIAGPQAGSDELAGQFFYGQRYDLPEEPVICCKTRNERTYCIPEIEPYYDQPEERSRRAIAWLQAVMAEAKRVGLTIQFSFEPRGTSPDTSLTLQTSRWIIQHYPQIDILEWITQEAGHSGESLPLAELKTLVAEFFGTEYFGPEALQDPDLQDLLHEDMGQFPQIVRELGHNLRALRDFQAEMGKADSISTCLSVYCVDSPDYLNACLALLRRGAPANTTLGFMSDYGSFRSSQSFAQVKLDAQDYTRTMLYNWLEFDGLMYLQQNGVQGIRQTLAKALSQTGDQPLYGICYNHWRTAENRTTARYASVSGLYGPLPEEDFYREYAGRLGIQGSKVLAEALGDLNELEKYITNDLFNIGFCYGPCWGSEGLGWFDNWEPATIREVTGCMSRIGSQVATCRENTNRAAGLDYLELLVNRVECTVLYLRGIQRGCELQPLVSGKQPSDLTPAEQASVDRVCGEAFNWLGQYLLKLAGLLPDRGAEGTLISAYHTPLAVLKRIRSQYGTTRQTPDTASSTGSDAPPAPALS